LTTKNRFNRYSMHIGVLPKILGATLLAGLLPLLLMGYSGFQVSRDASERATAAATRGLDSKELNALQQQTGQTAQEIARILNRAVDDTRSVALMPRTAAAYLDFYRIHQGAIHYPAGTTTAPRVQTDTIPLYPELAYIDKAGREQLRILNGQVVPTAELRDVSNPANTTYHTETYFSETRALPPGEVYVSRLTAWHTSTALQPAGAPQAGDALSGSNFGRYQGYYRLGAPLFDAQGNFDGMVLLSLDARHLIEPLIHILPGEDATWTAWPSFVGGNYAFMFDDEGYVLAHPTLAGLRGLDAQGHLISPWRSDMTVEEQAKHPYYMPNSPAAELFKYVLAGKSGFVINPNVVGTLRANVYAPIPFAHGVYRQSGLFGGLVIGANVEDFHKSATSVSDSIDLVRMEQQSTSLLITGLAIVLLILTAVLVARSITRPVLRLTAAAREMEEGELDVKLVDSVATRSFPDELNKLAQVFKDMAVQVQLRERRLQEQIFELNIQLDEHKKEEQVAEITETDYFRGLQQKAQRLRASQATVIRATVEQNGTEANGRSRPDESATTRRLPE